MTPTSPSNLHPNPNPSCCIAPFLSVSVLSLSLLWSSRCRPPTTRLVVLSPYAQAWRPQAPLPPARCQGWVLVVASRHPEGTGRHRCVAISPIYQLSVGHLPSPTPCVLHEPPYAALVPAVGHTKVGRRLSSSCSATGWSPSPSGGQAHGRTSRRTRRLRRRSAVTIDAFGW